MEGREISLLIRKQSFEPIRICLSDGRTVLIRHPDQVVVARRHVIFGLAQIRSKKKSFSTPTKGDAVATDWMLVDLIHVASIELANGKPSPNRRS